MPRNSKAYKAKAFAEQYVTNGFNATQAYKALKPNAKLSTANTEGSKTLNKPATREAIIAAMNKYGVNDQKVSQKISEFLAKSPDSKESMWAIDRGLTHARAILGLDAAKEIHSTVDKRELKLTADVSSSELQSIISSNKPK